MSEHEWRITSERLFPADANPLNNQFYGYRTTNLALPDGQEATYHGVHVGDCVHVVALEDDETTYLVRQSRPNARRIGAMAVPQTLELPGGFAEPDLSLEESAQQELAAEIHRTATSLTPAGIILPSPGVSDEHDHIFIGTGLVTAEASAEEATEQDMQIVAGKFGKLYTQILTSELPVSGQTLAAMAKVAALL